MQFQKLSFSEQFFLQDQQIGCEMLIGTVDKAFTKTLVKCAERKAIDKCITAYAATAPTEDSSDNGT